MFDNRLRPTLNQSLEDLGSRKTLTLLFQLAQAKPQPGFVSLQQLQVSAVMLQFRQEALAQSSLSKTPSQIQLGWPHPQLKFQFLFHL